MLRIKTDRLINREEVEARFGISKRFLEIKAKSGEGPRIVRIGRLVRYREKTSKRGSRQTARRRFSDG